MQKAMNECFLKAAEHVRKYRAEMPKGFDPQNAGGSLPKAPAPPLPPSSAKAAKNASSTRKPKGFLSTIMGGMGPNVDNSQNQKTLLGG